MDLGGESFPCKNVGIVGPFELLFKGVDLLVAEAGAVPLELSFQSQARLVVFRATGDTSGVAVIAPAVRFVRVRATLQFGH